MNDTPPFSPFATQPPPAPMFPADPAIAGKKTRKKRGPKVTKAPKQARKPRHDIAKQVKTLGADSLLPPNKMITKRKPRKPQALKIDPMIVFEAAVGLGLEDVAGVAQLIEEIQKFPKKSRTKIVAALAKVFA